MEISARSYLTAGVSLTATTALAFAPLSIPTHHHTVTMPHVTVSELRLAVSPVDIEAFIGELQTLFDGATTTVTDVAGIPGQSLIGVVDNIVELLGTVFTGLIDATGNQTLVASLTILKTLSVDAFAKLAENLGLINPVITTTTAQVGELLSSALTGSLQNILVATANVINDPLSVADYAGLLTAGVAGGQLLVGNGLKAVQAVGDGLFDIAGIALSEVTFQLNNAAAGISALLTQLATASDNAVVQAVLGAIRGLVIAPAVAVFNLGSGVAGAVLTTAHTGFDVLLDAATSVVTGVTTDAAPAVSDFRAAPALEAAGKTESATAQILDDPALPVVDPVVAAEVPTVPVTPSPEKAEEPSSVVAPVVDHAEADDVAVEDPAVEDPAVGDGATEDETTAGELDRKSVADTTVSDEPAPAGRSHPRAGDKGAEDNDPGDTDSSADHEGNSSDVV